MQSSLSKFTTTRNPGELSSERQLFCFQKTSKRNAKNILDHKHQNLKAFLSLDKNKLGTKIHIMTLFEVIMKLLLTFKLKRFH